VDGAVELYPSAHFDVGAHVTRERVAEFPTECPVRFDACGQRGTAYHSVACNGGGRGAERTGQLTGGGDVGQASVCKRGDAVGRGHVAEMNKDQMLATVEAAMPTTTIETFQPLPFARSLRVRPTARSPVALALAVSHEGTRSPASVNLL
jgi:hypothetical protein